MKNLIERLSIKTGLTKLEVTALLFIIASVITGVVLHYAGVGASSSEIKVQEKSSWEVLQKEKDKVEKEKLTKKGKTQKTKSEPVIVNINTGTIDDFDQLPGISPKIAEEIVGFRTINGPFKSVDDLILVKGIGPAKLAKIKDLVTK